MTKAKVLFLFAALVFAAGVFLYARATAKYAHNLPAGLETALSE